MHNYETPLSSTDVSSMDLEKVILLGGPPGLPGDLRVQCAEPTETRIKISYCGGYEHFEREPDTIADGLPAFRWTGRTRVAE